MTRIFQKLIFLLFFWQICQTVCAQNEKVEIEGVTYTITAPTIGEGGLSAIYIATSDSGPYDAVKILHPEFTDRIPVEKINQVINILPIEHLGDAIPSSLVRTTIISSDAHINRFAPEATRHVFGLKRIPGRSLDLILDEASEEVRSKIPNEILARATQNLHAVLEKKPTLWPKQESVTLISNPPHRPTAKPLCYALQLYTNL